MVELSMQAALIIYTASFLLGLLVIFIFTMNQDKNKNIRYFLGYFLISSIGALLLLFRENINSPFISIIIGNTLIIGADILLIIGINNLLDHKTNYPFLITDFSVFLILFIIFTYGCPSVFIRIMVLNCVAIFLFIYGILVLHKYKSHYPSSTEMMSTVFMLLVVALIFRSIIQVFQYNTNSSFLTNTVDSYFIVLFGVISILVVVGLFSILNAKGQQRLEESERSKTSILSNLPGFAYRCLNDEFWTMIFLSDGFQDVTGYDKTDVIGNKVVSFEELIVPSDRHNVRDLWERALQDHKRFASEYQIQPKTGKAIWVWEQGIGIYNDDNEVVAIEGYIANIDSRKIMEHNLEFLSYRDSLTGLYNRRYIEEEIVRLDQSRNLPISIMMADVNGLKFINDSFGHDHGDKVIVNIARILEQNIRSSELIGRLGGDEFIVILQNTSESDCEKIVDRIQRQSQQTAYEKLGLSVAIGYDTKTTMETGLFDIRKQAENKMYREKLYSKPSLRRKAINTVMMTLFEKDEISEIHSNHVAEYAKQLANALKLSEYSIKQVETAALLHDVGKIIIDDKILKSTDKLSKEEWEIMKKHPEIGYRILNSNTDLSEIADIILSHHEHWNGNGYPNQIAGEEIPYLSRIISICDAYDAMINRRLYKKALTKQQAIQELQRCSGTQFDPALVQSFIQTIQE